MAEANEAMEKPAAVLPDDLRIASLHAAYAAGRLTPVDVVHAVYDRIDACPDKAVWIVLVPRDEAVARAAVLLQQQQQQREDGATAAVTAHLPLFGIPFSVKDLFDVAGLDTTAGCPSFAYRATRTAAAVQRCLDAGAILVGKTNLDQFATGLVGHRSPYGTPRCVFDRAYISGGSSSGAAVSVAAGLVVFALATDTAGSIRVPAALNGLVGWKPTPGTLSAAGVVPAVPTADCVGVLARSVADAAAADAVLRGFDPDDVFARRSLPAWPWPWPHSTATATVRFGVPPDAVLAAANLAPAYARLFQAAVAALAAAPGFAQSRDFDYAPFQAANDLLYGGSLVAQRLAAFDPYLQAHGLKELHPAIQAVFSASMAPASGPGTATTPATTARPAAWDAVRAYKDLFALQAHRRRAEQQFAQHVDVLVVPSTVAHFTVAEIDADPLGPNTRLGAFSHFVNPLDLCAVALPAGTWANPAGRALPFGITLVAQAGRDAALLALARRVQAVLPPPRSSENSAFWTIEQT